MFNSAIFRDNRFITAENVWILLDKNNKPVMKDSVYITFKGNKITVTGGKPPHKIGSTGRIYSKEYYQEYFPQVCNLKWVNNNETNKNWNTVRV